MRLLLVWLFALTGCAQDPCADAPGACVVASIRGDAPALDQLAITVDRPSAETRLWPDPPRSFTLPTAIVLRFPAGTSGVVQASVDAFSRGAKVAQAALPIVLPSSGRVDATFTLQLVGAESLVLAPVQFTFPLTAKGLESQPASFVVTNHNNAAHAALPNATLAGAQAASYVVTRDDCAGVALAASQSCTVEVAFAPSALGLQEGVLAVGTLSAALAGTAVAWAVEASGMAAALTAIWGRSASSVFAVGSGGKVLFSTGNGQWTAQSTPLGTIDLYTVYGTSNGHVFAAGDGINIIEQLPSATGWSTVPVPSGAPVRGYALWAPPIGSANDSIFVVGAGKYLTWTAGSTPPQMSLAMSVSTPARALSGSFNPSGGGTIGLTAVGDNNTTQSYSSSAGGWTGSNVRPGSSIVLYGVWVGASNKTWLVGTGGLIESAAPEPSGVSTDLYAVWGDSISDLYAVGAKGVILRSSGDGTWSREESGTDKDLKGVWGSSGGNVYVVGDGVILHKH